VMHEYKAEQPDELTLEVGQLIEILKQVCYNSALFACAFDSVDEKFTSCRKLLLVSSNCRVI